VLSLRLKLENTERGLGDQRAMAAELADRYGDTQRELGRVKAAVQVASLSLLHLLFLSLFLPVLQQFFLSYTDMNDLRL
jgi:hypothetical protein